MDGQWTWYCELRASTYMRVLWMMHIFCVWPKDFFLVCVVCALNVIVNQSTEGAAHGPTHTVLQHTIYIHTYISLGSNALNRVWSLMVFFFIHSCNTVCSTGDGSVQSFIALFRYVKRLLYFVCDVRTTYTQSNINVRWTLIVTGI